MKTDPARPIFQYEPRNVTVRRELFRFADAHDIICAGDHHTHRSANLEEVWQWQFSGATIPMSELLILFHSLYPRRTITFSALTAEDGTEIVVVSAPALPEQARGQ